MILRLAIAITVVGSMAALLALWRRPPRKLEGRSLAAIGVKDPAVVQFATPTCAPCKAAVPRLREAASRSGLSYHQVDIADQPDVARAFGIRTVPTIAVTGAGGRVLGVWTSLPPGEEIALAAGRARAGAA